MSFGRFRKGKLIEVPAGECVYVGSALGKRGATGLGRRLVRHASRSESQKPHLIREQLLAQFAMARLGQGNLRPKQPKRLYWNIDHLLDRPEAELTHIIAIRSQFRLEGPLGQMLEQDQHTFILEKGLGANDLPGHTHLLGVRADETWWSTLPTRVQQLLAESDHPPDTQ